MIAVLGGLGAALCWGMTSVLAQRAGLTLGALSTFAWGSILGAVIVVGPAVIAAVQSPPSAAVTRDLVAAGALNVLGLVAQFSALRRDDVSVVVQITSAEGAVAATLAALTGASLPVLGWLALGLVAAGILLSVAARWRTPGSAPGSLRVPTVLAVAAALSFGAGLFFQGRAGLSTPLGLAIAPPSLMGVALVALPLASARRVARPGRAIGWVAGLAVAELAGFLCYVVGARHSVPVAAILSAQYATVSVLIGLLALGERLSATQVLAYALTIAGITLISIAS